MLAVISLLCAWHASAGSPRALGSGVENAQLLDNLALSGELFHVQGVDMDARHIWVTSVDRRHHRGYLHEFDRTTGQFLRRVELTDGPRYHPGGISVLAHSLWVPVAESRPDSSAVLEEIDIESLQVRRRIAVADHLGCVAASDSKLIAGNWNSRLLYVFDLSGQAPVQIVPNPSRTRYQDMKFVDGELVASGTLTRSSGTIEWIDWRTMKVLRSLRAGATPPEGSLRTSLYTRAGMTLQGRELYLVPLDGPGRMFHFRIDR